MTTKNRMTGRIISKYTTPLSISVIAGTALSGNIVLAAEHVVYYRHSDHMWGIGSGWMFRGMAMMLVFWAVVIVLIVWAAGRNDAAGSSNAALDILKERLARGEIEIAEIEERRKALGK